MTIKFPHLMRLVEETSSIQSTHEHYSYFSFLTVERIFAAHGIALFDVEEVPTHGGSLPRGFNRLERYSTFTEQVKETKRKLLEFLIRAKRERKSIAGCGAPGKGSTLLNYCGIRTDFIDYTVDRNPYKQGKFLLGMHIPI